MSRDWTQCVDGICRCDNGVVIDDDLCPLHDQYQCTSCDESYHMVTNSSGSFCELNQCRCPFGQLSIHHEGEQCTDNGFHVCTPESCKVGFDYHEFGEHAGECVDNGVMCSCENGTHSVGKRQKMVKF